jgi:hypothetical protein
VRSEDLIMLLVVLLLIGALLYAVWSFAVYAPW